MKFEAIDKKLREVGLQFNEPTIERRKDKWHFELRIECDRNQYINGWVQYFYFNEYDTKYKQIGHFIASGSNINKLVTILFERMKSKEVIFKHCNKIDNKSVWQESIVTWDEVKKKFIKNLVISN